MEAKNITKITFMGNDDLAKFLGGSDYAIIINKLEMLNDALTGHFSEGKKWLRIGLFAGEEDITWAGLMSWLSPAITKRYLTQLKEDGLIEFKQIKGKGRSLYYWLNIEAINTLNQPVARASKKQAIKVTNLGKNSNLVKSNLPNSNIKSDLTNSEVTSHYSSNQVSRIVELPLTNSETSNIPNNHENPKTPTTTSATQNVAYEVVEVVTSQATIEELVIAYCEALELDIRIDSIKTSATKLMSELKGLYPDLMPLDVKKVIFHANEVHKFKPSQLKNNWLKLTNEVALMNDSHLTEITQAIKGIYSLNGNTPYAKLWDIYGVASQAKLYQLQASDFTGFTSKWPSTLNLPNLDKLLTNVNKYKGENEHASNRNGITGIGVGKVDPTTWDELASRTI